MQSAVAVTALLLAWTAFQRGSTDEAYFTWSAADAERIGRAAYKQGRVGGLFDMRGLKTERSYNYKLAATWLTPDVVRATARLSQLRSRLSREETQHIVVEAERSGETIVIVEIDPREGSGVIPNEWEAFFQPKGRPDAAVRGTSRPELRDIRGLAGVLRRNYDYDRFWVTFPLTADGKSVFRSGDGLAELVVRIHDKEGRVEWALPAFLREPPELIQLFRCEHTPKTTRAGSGRPLTSGCPDSTSLAIAYAHPLVVPQFEHL